MGLRIKKKSDNLIMSKNFGPLESPLNSAITSSDIASENLNAAQSRITDVDHALEAYKSAQSQIEREVKWLLK